MAIGIDDLDFDEEGTSLQTNEGTQDQNSQGSSQEPLNTNQEQTIEQPLEQHETVNSGSSSAEDDIINDFLREKGISDPQKIKFEGDNGDLQERAWNSLSKEEKLNILRDPVTQDNDLSDDEIELLNIIRSNNLTPQQYLSLYRDNIIKEINSQQEPSYTVDELDDDDLFVLDLQARVEGITEEQLQRSLEKAKEDEQLFKKQIEGLRKEYKSLEDQQRQQNAVEQEEYQKQQYQQFADVINQHIQNLDSIAGLDVELDQDDKNELAEFILGQDEAGVSNLGKVLNDPESLVLMAWYALNGDKMIDDITTMYNNSLSKVKRDAYNKGLEDGRKGVQQGRLVVTQPNKSQEQQAIAQSIDQLDF